MPAQIIINVIIAAAVYGVFALSFSLIYSTTRFFNFSHASVCSLGAYGTLFAITTLRMSFLPAALVGNLFAAIIGGLVYFLIFAPLRKKSANAVVLLVASLGSFVVLQNLIALAFGDGTYTVRTWAVTEGLPLLGGRITVTQIVLVAVSGLLLFLTLFILRATKAGLLIRALADDWELSRALGTDTERIVVIVFIAASALAAIAGLLYACDVDLTPLLGFRLLLRGVVAAIVGGINRPSGALPGALLVSGAENLASWSLSTQWQDVAVFLILIGFLLLRPYGFFGTPLKSATI